MADKDIRFFFSGQDKASAIFDKVGGKAIGLSKKIGKIGKDIKKMSQDIYAATTAILKYANGWAELESQVAASDAQLQATVGRMLGGIGDRFESEKARIGTIIDPAEQEKALDDLRVSVEKNLRRAVKDYQAAQAEVDAIEGGWIDAISANHAEATKIARDGAQKRADSANQIVESYQAQQDEIRKLQSEETKLQKQREEAFKAHFAGVAYVEQLQLQVDALKMSKEALAEREIAQKTANEEQAKAARALMAERDAIIAGNEAREKAKQTIQSWQEAVSKAYADATKAQQDARKAAWEAQKAEKQQRDDLYKTSIENVTRERIAFEQGEEAARKYELGLQGLDDARAAEIAGLEEKLRKEQEAANKKPDKVAAASAPGELSAREGRLLTGRGVGMDYAKTTADESKKSASLLKKVVDQGRELIRAVQNLVPPDFQGV